MSGQALRVEEQIAPYLVAPQITDHLDNFASAPEGFKRLRELVLNLAVRGRLVPQDPKDEPAEKLLARIRSAGSGVVLAPEDTAPFAVPASWAWTTLGEVTNVGETIKADALHDDVWVLDLEDIEKDTSKVTRKVRFSERQSKSDKNVFSAGDVLYGKLRPYLNKVIVADEPGVCTTEILPLRGYGSIDANYIKTFLKSPGFIEYVNAKSYGMKMPRLGTTDAKRAHFALPPLAEQSRIVAKVEELMALINRLEEKVSRGDTARGKLLDTLLAALADSPDAAATADAWAQLAPHFDLLLQTPADVDRLQQTLLTLAVKGRLVPQDPNDEPAVELLKRIGAERERMVSEGKIKRDLPLSANGADEEPFVLPDGWQWVRLNQLLSKIGAGSTPLGGKEVYVSSGVKFLRSQNVWNDGLRLTDTAYIKPETHEKMSGTRVHPNDLLFNITGASIGRCAVVPENIGDANVSQHVTIIRPVFGGTTAYLHLVLISAHVQQTVMNVQVGVSREGLSIGKLGNFVIPVPPLPEQSRIVAAVASLTALCDRLRERLAARRDLSAKLAGALTESALA